MRTQLFILAFAALTAAGCASAPKQTPLAGAPVARIAVLPVAKESASDEMGPLLSRRMVQRWLAERGYVTVPLPVVDQAASDAGLNDASLLTEAQRQTLLRDTGAEALARVRLLAFRVANEGYHSERRVGLSIQLLDARTGAVVWQDTDQVVHEKKTSNPVSAITEYVRGWGTQAIEGALQSQLYPETNELVQRMLSRLPRYQLS